MTAIRTEMGSDPISPRANYLWIRHSHYRITLRGWLKGLDKALIAIASALTFMLTAMVAMAIIGMAQTLLLLFDSSASPTQRMAVIAAWQGLSFLLLRALREAALMPKAQFFLDSLPIPPRQKLRADAVLALLSYSFLWLPVAWVIIDPLGAHSATLAGTISQLAGLVLVSLCVNLTWLRARSRHALVCSAALVAFAALPGADPWMEAARTGCALLGVAGLWMSYQPGAARAPARPRRLAMLDRLAISSGLVIPLLTHELRANLAVRCGCILATLAACLALIQVRTNDTSTASVLLFVAAMAALALYSLPAMLRRTLMTRLHFLAGQPAFARRMRAAVYLLPSGLFCVALALGGSFDRSGRAGIDAAIFTALYLTGVGGTRANLRVMPWLMPFAITIAVIILGAMT
jgi:hypothetical protein